jgi:hypothetical protein
MNEKKVCVINFIIFILLETFVLTGILVSVLGSGRAGLDTGAADGNAGATADTVGRLEGTVEEQRGVIGDLRSENQRLREHLMGAIAISESLTGTVEASGTYTSSATEVSKRIRAGIENLEDWYNNVRRDLPGIADMGTY